MWKAPLYATCLLGVLAVTGTARAEIPRDPNLVIYYSYEEVGAIVPDESGKGHDGTVCGDVSAAPSGIKWFGAAEFQGIWGPTGYSYLDLDSPHYPAEDIPKSAITLAAWCKCRDTRGLPRTDHHAIMSTRASDNTWVMHPQINNDGTFRWLLRAKGAVTIFNLNGVGSHGWDEWLHYAGTYDSVTGKGILYINGEVCAQIGVTPGQLIADWGTGARVGYNIDNARPFTGLMDELYLFTRALSQDEINDLLALEALRPPTPTRTTARSWIPPRRSWSGCRARTRSPTTCTSAKALRTSTTGPGTRSKATKPRPSSASPIWSGARPTTGGSTA